MKEESLVVWYVTGTQLGLGTESDEGAHAAVIAAAMEGRHVTARGPATSVRVDLGKFFSEKDAREHAKSLGQGWRNVLVEARTETVSEQHPAHR